MLDLLAFVIRRSVVMVAVMRWVLVLPVDGSEGIWTDETFCRGDYEEAF